MKERVRTSVVVVHNGKLLTFFAIDPHSKKEYYFLPGGAIESNETATEAAERETYEETGYKIEVDPGTCLDKDYIFHWNNEDFDCLTFFYRGRLLYPFADPDVVVDASYNKGVVWIPLGEIADKFSYSEIIRDTLVELIESRS
jgi:8-oxo-dGTP pyrophosphatase MutT (NUDIX family)